MAYFVYLLECCDGSFYCGYTKDLKKRVKAHNDGIGARYTRAKRPVKIIYFEKLESRIAALKREIQIKSLSRKKKQEIISAKQQGKTKNI